MSLLSHLAYLDVLYHVLLSIHGFEASFLRSTFWALRLGRPSDLAVVRFRPASPKLSPRALPKPFSELWSSCKGSVHRSLRFVLRQVSFWPLFVFCHAWRVAKSRSCVCAGVPCP